MRLKEGFNIHNVCGSYVIVAEGEENIDVTNVIGINETAAFIWESVIGKDFTIDDMVEALLSEYEVDRARAEKDCKLLVKKLEEAGVLQ